MLEPEKIKQNFQHGSMVFRYYYHHHHHHQSINQMLLQLLLMWTLFGVSDLQGSLQGGGERPLRFRVPPIRTMLISSVEHWKTSTYRSFIVFLWHFWATINALSGDFIWMKASPDGRPCTDRGRNPINK